MAPRRAAEIFLRRHPDAGHYRVILFASLAATGKGHMTDKAIEEIFSPRSFEVLWAKRRRFYDKNGIDRKTRKGRNPQTGEQIKIKGRNVIKFKASKNFT